MAANAGVLEGLDDAHQHLLKHHAGYWAEQILGFRNQPHHWEWYDAEVAHSRLAVVAPREFAKSEVFSVITTTHRIQWPGYWQYIFSDTADQAKEIAKRVVSMVTDSRPDLVEVMHKDEETDKIFANFARLTTAGSGKKVRGAHPDRIVGDDILSDDATNTHYQRQKTKRWWFGTVANMAHPPLARRIGWGKIRPESIREITVPSTNIVLAGTPFHKEDLLMGMADNAIYHYRRYEAIGPAGSQLGDVVAVEVH